MIQIFTSTRIAYDFLVEIDEQINLAQVQITRYLCSNLVCAIDDDAYNDHLWRSSCAISEREEKKRNKFREREREMEGKEEDGQDAVQDAS